MSDFDWDDMYIVGRVPAGILFWPFLILMNMTLLNILLAILMDAYSMVKSESGGGCSPGALACR